MATCTSQVSFLFPPYGWDVNATWDCAVIPGNTDDVILSNVGSPVIVNRAEAAASIRWETLTEARSLQIGAGKSLTISGAVNLNGTATYSVSFTGTGTFSPATTVYYCSSSTVTGIDCQSGGPPPSNPPISASVENDLAFALLFLGIIGIVAWKRKALFGK